MSAIERGPSSVAACMKAREPAPVRREAVTAQQPAEARKVLRREAAFSGIIPCAPSVLPDISLKGRLAASRFAQPCSAGDWRKPG